MTRLLAVCDPTLLAIETNKNKQTNKNIGQKPIPNVFWFYLVSSNLDTYLKCNRVKVSIFFEKCSKINVYRNRNSKGQISKKTT